MNRRSRQYHNTALSRHYFHIRLRSDFLKKRGGGTKQVTWWYKSIIQATWQAEARGSKVQGQPAFYSEFKARLGNRVSFCLKIKKIYIEKN